MNPLKITVAALLSASLAATAGAAGTSNRLTLDEAIAKGFSTSHRLAELGARQEGAEAAARGARAAKLPVASVQAGYTRTSHVQEFGLQLPGQPFRVIYPDVPDNYRTRLDLQWPIYNFGRADALERAARAEADATGLDLAAARNDLKLEITRAFWAVVTATETVRVVGESVARMDATVDDVGNHLKVGLAAPNDVLSAKAQRARQQMLLIQARNMLEQARTDFRRLVGDPPDAPVELDAVLDAPTPPEPAADALVASAREARPDRKALEVRVAGAGDRLQASKAGRRPVVSVGGGVNYSNPNPLIFPRAGEWNATFDASVNVSWTLWDFGRTSADIAGSVAAARAARERLADFDTALDVEVRQRRLDLDSARASVTAADDSVRAATEARRVVGERFDAGVATPTDVLDAQVALLQAGLDRAQALAAVHLAQARLDRALGR